MGLGLAGSAGTLLALVLAGTVGSESGLVDVGETEGLGLSEDGNNKRERVPKKL